MNDGLPARLSTRAPKGNQLREILADLIASLQPGDALPSERMLAERYGVARMTVRSEVDRLATEGALYRVQGRGTFVAEPRVAQAFALSSFSEDMRARGLEPGSEVLRSERAAAGEHVAAQLAIEAGDEVLRVDRVRTADGTPMALEEAFLPVARYPGISAEELASGSLFELLSERYGVRLAMARQEVLAVAIDGEEAERLDVASGQPGFRFHTTAQDESGAIAFYGTSLFRGDRYAIELDQQRR